MRFVAIPVMLAALLVGATGCSVGDVFAGESVTESATGSASGSGVEIATEDPEVRAGADLFASVGCLDCHAYGNQGGPGPGPNLSNIGSLGRGEEYWVEWVRDPQAIKPGTVMPGFPRLTDEQLHRLAAFLEASKTDG